MPVKKLKTVLRDFYIKEVVVLDIRGVEQARYEAKKLPKEIQEKAILKDWRVRDNRLIVYNKEGGTNFVQ